MHTSDITGWKVKPEFGNALYNSFCLKAKEIKLSICMALCFH